MWITVSQSYSFSQTMQETIIFTTLCFIAAFVKSIPCYSTNNMKYTILGWRWRGRKKKKISHHLNTKSLSFAPDDSWLSWPCVYVYVGLSITSVHVCLCKNGPQTKTTSAKGKGRLCILWPIWFQLHTAPNTRKSTFTQKEYDMF